MKFSGHETFHVRDSWLFKGMRLLHERPDDFRDKYMHDYLGVGSNMGKSIKHWLGVTGLAEPVSGERGSIQLSELGLLVYENDPYMIDPFTWWVLHINLVHNSDQATSWSWFFNNYHQTQFKKEQCMARLVQYLENKATKLPSYKTLENDIGCLLSSCSQIIPDKSDPEENYSSPFAHLGLMSYFTETGRYHLNMGYKKVPACALGYSLAKVFNPQDFVEVPIDDAVIAENGPGKCFLMRASELVTLVEEIEAVDAGSGIKLTTLNGMRRINFGNLESHAWAQKHYLKD